MRVKVANCEHEKAFQKKIEGQGSRVCRRDQRSRTGTCQNFGGPAEGESPASSGLGQSLDQNSKRPCPLVQGGPVPQGPPVKV